MAKKPWTAAELRKFDKLTMEQGSPNQLTRIRARLRLREFITLHGREKCDAMFAHLQQAETKS